MVLFADLGFELTILDLMCSPEHPTWHVQPNGPLPRKEAFGAVTGRLRSRLKERRSGQSVDL